MQEYGIYFGKESFYQKIRDIGGEWNDSKERPIVCMLKSKEVDGLYWAIPLGRWDHRSDEAQERINTYLSFPESDIRSCYYHVGNTDTKSIFFITDAVPIIESYVERAYLNRRTSEIYVIKNKVLIKEVDKKLRRILSFENSKPNTFRQHISDMRDALILELNVQVQAEQES